jgi:pimeloyl-ACP methyl ester carboxylesterase
MPHLHQPDAPVVLLHGALQDRRLWALQIDALAAAGRTVLALDLPGHGDAPGPAAASIEAAAQWLLAELQRRGVARATLVGHSMGSLVALEAASHWGEQATGLVLVGTASPMRVAPALLQAALDEPMALIPQIAAISHGVRGAPASRDEAQRWATSIALMSDNQSHYAAAGHGSLAHHDLALCDAYADALAAAARVRCPSLVVVGERDKMTPGKAATALIAALNAALITLPAGHAMMSDAAEALNAALLRR